MSCQGCQDSAAGTANQTRSFDAAFARFWPEHQPFPPATPWLAAAVSRAEAKQWAVDVGADRDPGVLAGDMQAMLHVVGLAMAGGGGYANVREGKKKKNRKKGGGDISTTEPCKGSSFQSLLDCAKTGDINCTSGYICRPVQGGFGWEFCLDCLESPSPGDINPSEIQGA